MKKTWLVPCCALGMLLYAGTAHAAFWQILRDTPVRADATVGAKVLGTAKKGWIVSDMTGDGSSPQWIRMVEFQTKSGEGMAYAHFLYKVPDAYISAADVVQVADGDGTPLQQAGAASTATAVAAQGVRVERMVAPQVTAMACNGAVDEAALKTALAEMGQNAADAVEAAMEALCTADAEAAAAVVQGDGRINNMERDIEHRCMTLLLRQQPVAGDLRRISTAMKVVTDIERIGDHASDIAEIIPHLVTVRKEGDPAVSQAIAMGRKAYQMIQDAMAALTAEDELAARKVIAADDAVDFDFNAIKHTLAQEIAADPAKVDAALDLLMVIKYLERIGDHAVNVAEWVQFVRTGRYKDESMF